METAQRKKRRTRRIIAVVCAIVVIGYPLSMGPAVWGLSRGYLPERAFVALCKPTTRIHAAW